MFDNNSICFNVLFLKMKTKISLKERNKILFYYNVYAKTKLSLLRYQPSDKMIKRNGTI